MNVSRLKVKFQHILNKVYSLPLLQVLPRHLKRYIPLIVCFENVTKSQVAE